MSTSLPTAALDQLFTNARTFNKFTDQAISDETINALYDLVKMGPTAMNSQPARYVFVRSAEAKQKLNPAMAPSNAEKTLAAPLTVIVAMDTRFQRHITAQFPAYDAKPMLDANPAQALAMATLGSSLSGAYFIMAARALGLDCGPMGGFDAEKVNELFFAGTDLKANFLINVGYGDASGNHPRGPRLSFDEVAQII